MLLSSERSSRGCVRFLVDFKCQTEKKTGLELHTWHVCMTKTAKPQTALNCLLPPRFLLTQGWCTCSNVNKTLYKVVGSFYLSATMLGTKRSTVRTNIPRTHDCTSCFCSTRSWLKTPGSVTTYMAEYSPNFCETFLVSARNAPMSCEKISCFCCQKHGPVIKYQ